MTYLECDVKCFVLFNKIIIYRNRFPEGVLAHKLENNMVPMHGGLPLEQAAKSMFPGQGTVEFCVNTLRDQY